jgi:dTDP-4-dehydrorhamnose reductase
VKYAVLGAAGQLGREICVRLRGEVIPLSRAQVDLASVEATPAVWSQLRPDIVINCAAYNFVDRAETERDAAFAVNCYGVRSLARICADLGCTLVHFSSDYVFGQDEQRRTPYTETDAPGPVSVYGQSKLAGEEFVRAGCPKYILIRTCGLYGVAGSGGKGSNFVETMLRLAGQGKAIRVVADQVCTPSYAADVASAAIQLITGNGVGLYHITNAGSCSWFEFAAEIFRQAGVRADLTPITSAEYGAPARRPAYSVLESRLPPLRSWQDALAAYLEKRSRVKS